MAQPSRRGAQTNNKLWGAQSTRIIALACSSWWRHLTRRGNITTLGAASSVALDSRQSEISTRLSCPPNRLRSGRSWFARLLQFAGVHKSGRPVGRYGARNQLSAGRVFARRAPWPQCARVVGPNVSIKSQPCLRAAEARTGSGLFVAGGSDLRATRSSWPKFVGGAAVER